MSFFNRKKHTPDKDETSIGAILLKEGLISEEELKQGLEHVKSWRGKMMLGEALITMGCLSMEQLDLALTKQKLERDEITPSQAVVSTMEMQDALQNNAAREIQQITDKISSIKRSK